ncbi:ribonuclease H-like domain-containing protein, partial [Tanacetum coccineum]
SVLSSMQVYWGSVFQLPTTVIKDIETFFKGFLWCNANKESLWVKWINTVKLKGRSIWDTQCYGNDCWYWKTIPSLRNMVMDRIRHKIGNGRNISAWYDMWNDNQTLSNHISKREVCLAGFNNQSKLCDIVDGNRWKWPDDWMVKHNFLLNILVPTFNDKPDNVQWVTNQGKMKTVKVKARIKSNATTWKDIIKDMAVNKNQNNIWCIIGKLCLAATVYYVWQERNYRIFKSEFRDKEVITKLIFDDVRSRLMPLKKKKSNAVNDAAKNWETTQMDNSLYIGVLLVGLLFVKGSWSRWAAYDEGNRVYVKDEPSWSPQYAVKGVTTRMVGVDELLSLLVGTEVSSFNDDSSRTLLKHIITSLHFEFDMNALGELNYFLGIFVVRISTGLFLSQRKYAFQLLKRAHMINYNCARTPVDTESKLGLEGVPHTLSRSSVDVEYRGVANVVAETVRLQKFLHELHSSFLFATLVYCDNVRVLHVPSRYQSADIFSKGLPSALFEEFRSSLSVRRPPAPVMGEC